MALVNAISPILLLGELFCLAPFSVVEMSANNRTYFSNHKKTIVYTVRMISLLGLLAYAVIYRQIKLSIFVGKGPFAATVYFTDYNWRIPGMLLIYGFGNFCNRRIIEAMNGILNLDQDFKAFGYNVRYDKAKVFTTVALCTFALKALVQLGALAYGAYFGDFIKADFIVLILPSVQCHVMIMQWMGYLLLIKYHFRLLNKLLKLLKYRTCWMMDDLQRTKNRGGDVLVVAAAGGGGGIPKKISTLTLLQASGKMYSKLCYVSRKVNESFAWQFLFMLPVLFIEIIMASYKICQVLKKKREFDLPTMVFDLIYFVAVLEIVLPCVAVKNEAEKFVDLLHKLELSERDNNEDIDAEMNVMILQTQHQKVQFSACRVFPLDGTLIYSILGAMTTYLVILLQFDAQGE